MSGEAVPLEASLVLAGCHQLIYSDGTVLGDPMEKAALSSIGWTYHSDQTCVRRQPLGAPSLTSMLPPSVQARVGLRILKRFPFSSDLKRSSTVVDVAPRFSPSLPVDSGSALRIAAACDYIGCRGLFVLTKGSPETIKELLATVPPGYDECYQAHTRLGKRVLALASKRLHAEMGTADAPGADVTKLARDAVESGLTFRGLLVLHCPNKPESQAVLEQLRTSGHELQMLTGDALLTATHAAHTLGISCLPPLLLELEALVPNAAATSTAAAANGIVKAAAPPPPRLRWRPWCASASEPALPMEELSALAFRALAHKYDLCLDGAGFAALHAAGALPAALPHLRVLARMSPGQKELALATHRDNGVVALMCGDGTNDVGALKRAAVSVALVTTSLVPPPPPPPPAALAEEPAGGGSSLLRSRKKGGGANGEAAGTASAREKQQKRLEERLQREMMTLPAVKLGDASIAAAFTSKSANVSSCIDIITQGRCTLVTTTQMFKILALNCLVSAYALSVVHLRGVRMSDVQATTSGLGTAALFLFVSFAQPLPKLAPQRPPASVLAPSVLISVCGQFCIHLHSLRSGLEVGETAAANAGLVDTIEADSGFEPSITNTVVYLLSSSMLLTTFAVNYTGRPFMQSLTSNTGLIVTLIGSALLLSALSGGSLPDVASYLELVPLPEAASTEMLGLMGFDFMACLAIEKLIQRATLAR